MIPNIDNILNISSEEEFSRCALEVFRYQASESSVYAEYIGYLGVDPAEVDKVEKIPFLPIELFKSHKVYCGAEPHQIEFTSSGTTGTATSRHYVRDLSVYERSFVRGFEMFYGPVSEMEIYALLPGYLEREGSSLIYMIDYLIKQNKGGGFFLRNHDELMERLGRDTTTKKLLIGVSFALWELAEKYSKKLNNTVVMETGGMKGRRREIPREELHAILCNGFGVPRINSEYGMTELLSQAYSYSDGIFHAPPWMKVVVRDTRNPLRTAYNSPATGGINIIDLANIYSAAFIATSDLGQTLGEGKFRISGRLDGSDIRGCNLLIE